MKIAGFRPSRKAYDFLRCFNWMKEWGTLGCEVRYSVEGQPEGYPVSYRDDHFDYELERLAKWCDVLFTTVEQVIPHVARKIVELHGQYNFKLVCDNDDPLSIIEPISHDGVENLLRDADLVTFVSDVLANDYASMTRKHIVQPTCLPMSAFDITPMKGIVDAKKTNLIIMGWPYHVADLAMIRSDIEPLLKSGDFRLVSIGIWDEWFKRYDGDTIVNVPGVNIWERLIAFMKGVPNAIAIVPIRANCQETRYNNNAKFLDYTAASIPMIVSDVPNSSFLSDGVEVVKAGDSWSDTIKSTARNDVLRKRLRKNSKQRVMDEFMVESAARGFLDRITDALGVSAMESAL